MEKNINKLAEDQKEINLLKELLIDLKQMNEINPIDFGFVESTIWEYISGREWEIEQLTGKNKKMFIFDIDGCIMPSLFPNLTKQDPKEKEDLIKEVNQKGFKTDFYRSFFKFYRNNIKYDDLVYFITGRQESSFGALTRHQLSKLIHFSKIQPTIIFYPEDKDHVETEYLNWKKETIIDLFDIGFYHNVFDDMNGYFRDLKTIHGSQCHQVKSDEDWSRLNIKFRDQKKKLEKSLSRQVASIKTMSEEEFDIMLQEYNKKHKKLLECPNCKDTKLSIMLFNRFKKTHYYIVWCVNCDWSQKLNHKYGFSGSSKIFTQHILKGHEPHRNLDELRNMDRLNEEQPKKEDT